MPPEQQHGPHGEDEQGGNLIIPTNSLAASGSTNTTAALIASASVSWALATSTDTLDRDEQFAESFRLTGSSVLLQPPRADG
jgi:hypothetical protein